MNKKGVIIGIFVKKNRILSLLETLNNDFGIKISKTYIFSIEDNTNEYLVTFKTNNDILLGNRLKGSSIMHTKNGCIFSINALNTLISNVYGQDKKPNEIEIEWNKYKDKLIILNNGILSVKTLTRIEDKCSFFK